MIDVGLTVVIPCFDEAGNVGPLLEALDRERERAIPGLRVVLVDDGSRDGTWDALVAARDAVPQLPVGGVRFEKRSGQSAALWAGLQQVETPFAGTMDGDLQNDPADLERLVQRALADGVDVVCGYRADRKDRWSRRAASRLANDLRRRVTGDGVRDTGCSLKVFRAECIGDLPPYRGMHRFMPAWFGVHGRSVEEQAVGHHPRLEGKSKYTNLGRLPVTLVDLWAFSWVRKRLVKGPIREQLPVVAAGESEGVPLTVDESA